MKVSKDWLKELINLKVSLEEVQRLLPLRTIATKEITENFIELDMKGYNRADLLSMRGVAYEVAAITNSKLKFSEPDENEYLWIEQSFDKVDVKVDNPKLAPVYCVARIKGLKVEQSSDTWVKKLNDCGMRSVNNVADITNLIMLEYGQPLHSFDADKVSEQKIIVRTAQEGEQLETLDRKTRTLNSQDLLITDPQKPLGIAGVMGGLNSEITENTTSILLEAAIFEPTNLRKTATKLALQSEASKRFYHGLTKKRLLQAFNAAIRMYQDMGGKVTAITIQGGAEDQQKKVTLRLKKLNSLIGISLTDSEVEDYLRRLNFTLSDKITQNGDVSWVITPPFYRLDIEIEEDLIEEVARMYGYENITPKPLEGEVPHKIDQSLFELIHKIKSGLVNLGLTEVQTYSFYSGKVLNALGFDESNLHSLIKVANPISSETEYMRSNIWPNLLEAVAKNLKQGFEDIAIFELGKVYMPAGDNLPLEKYRLCLALTNKTDNPAAELNTIIHKLNQNLNLGIEFAGKITNPEAKTLYHPNRTQEYKKDNQIIGGIAEVHPRASYNLGISERVAIAEIDLLVPTLPAL